ncbi:ATP-binding cassette domain-containing protein [Thiolinea disciformis]|uniref:branched-chain amino acid ABC transporter ATP-binding protein/permease n=1 Tax=Thiolinea disciformis TaxID=125614 RepID=UPI00037F6ADE|nr:branched-chain amino acid ABC transporter ATP-binding protein/permease [Thiolinea disciformis]
MKPLLSSRMVLGVFIVLIAATPLVMSPFYITLLNYIGLAALVALGLVLLTGIGNLTSFGQAAFVGVGAYSTAFVTTSSSFAWLGNSPWAGFIIGLLITSAVALILGAITLKLSGHFLPLGTIAWGISLYYLFGTAEALGGHTGMTGIPPILVLGWVLDQGYEIYYLIWAFLLAAIINTKNLLDSREGRAIRALKGGRIMAEAMGVNTLYSRMAIFLFAALHASTSGWLYAHMQRFVNPTPFNIHNGIEYLFMAVIGGASSVWGAIVGSSLITILKQWLQDLLPKLFGQNGNFEVILFGLIMIIVLQRAQNGLWPLLAKLLPVQHELKTINPHAEPLAQRTLPTHGEVILEAKNVTRKFGGLIANNNMNLTVHAGEILALIGPNGAGKSTLFNQLSGVDTPSSGEVLFLGKPIGGLQSRTVAAMGMSRTFQHVKLLPTMTVLENVAIGAHQRGHKGVFSAAWRLERAEEERLLAEAARQIERVGLKELMHVEAGSLALGQQRILEIARALCSDPCLLLLDEPAAGLRHLEKQALADLLRRLKAQGMAILLVEHDMDFVMGLVDYVVVMEFGQKIAEGLPEAVQQNQAVLEAYLGGVE